MKAPTPVITKAVAKLLAQVQAEAQAATLEALSAKDGIVVLHDVDREKQRMLVLDDGSMCWIDSSGFRLSMYRQRFRPRHENWSQEYWRPSQWWVVVNRVDGRGRLWGTDLGYFVIDDFGTLVSVEGSAA